MATSKGQEMLGKAMRSKSRSVKKRGMVAGALAAYKGATQGLQDYGAKSADTFKTGLASAQKNITSLKTNPPTPFALGPFPKTSNRGTKKRKGK